MAKLRRPPLHMRRYAPGQLPGSLCGDDEYARGIACTTHISSSVPAAARSPSRETTLARHTSFSRGRLVLCASPRQPSSDPSIHCTPLSQQLSHCPHTYPPPYSNLSRFWSLQFPCKPANRLPRLSPHQGYPRLWENHRCCKKLPLALRLHFYQHDAELSRDPLAVGAPTAA